MEDIEKLLANPGHNPGKCHSTCSSAPNVFMTSPSGEPTNFVVQRQLGIFDIFKIGIGPSSSHTVGPMTAAVRFLGELKDGGHFDAVKTIRCDLFGSLALTGFGHGTDKAICVGLSGEHPSTVDPDQADTIYNDVKAGKPMNLGGSRFIEFDMDTCMVFHMDAEMPQHPNGLKLTAFGGDGNALYMNEFLSIGGGFIKSVAEFELESLPTKPAVGEIDRLSTISTRHDSDGENCSDGEPMSSKSSQSEALSSVHISDRGVRTCGVPYPFSTAEELLQLCYSNSMTIAELVMANECVLSCNGDIKEVYRRIDAIWRVMSDCIDRGKLKDGTMPVSGWVRQAPIIYRRLKKNCTNSLSDHFAIMDWITLYARSVNEENACGGRIVTSPTNGAAGTLPAVLAYYVKFHRASNEGIRIFLATAAAFGALCKMNASISGAEAGCQAEIGSACAMAAAGLAAAMGGTLRQIENAAEIGLEHNLGMTCDPLMGLVQIPCIERNCVASVKAITAYRLAINGDGSHEVSFDSCVETMYRTGIDMQAKYRETSTGGLALYARRPEKARNFKATAEVRE